MAVIDIFEPFRWLDVSQAYDEFGPWINFVLYFCLFYGLATVTLGRMYKQRGGNLVSVSTGLILSIALVLLEQNQGLNFVRSLGGAAGFIVVLLIFILLFYAIIQANLSKAFAFSASYVILFFGMNLVSTRIFYWAVDRFPILWVLASICIIYSLYYIIKTMIQLSPSSPYNPGNISLVLKPGSDRRESRIQSRLIKRELKATGNLTQDLKKLRELISNKRLSDPKQAADIIKDMMNKEHEFEKIMSRLNKETSKLSTAHKDVATELASIQADSGRLLGDLRYSLMGLWRELSFGNLNNALVFIDEALGCDAKLREAAKTMLRLEKQLKS